VDPPLPGAFGGAPWRVLLSRHALAQLAALDLHLARAAVAALAALADGRGWSGKMQRRRFSDLAAAAAAQLGIPAYTAAAAAAAATTMDDVSAAQKLFVADVAAATFAVVEVAPHCMGGAFAQVPRVHALERTAEGVDTAAAFVAAAHLLAAESAPVRLRLRSESAAAADSRRQPGMYDVDPDHGPVEMRLPARVGAGRLYDGWSPRQRPGGGATPEVLRFHLLTEDLAAAAWNGIGGGGGSGGGGTGAWASAAGGEGKADAAADMFPLLLSPREQQLVAKCLRQDLLVLGRGGTGKTTVTVHAIAAAAEEDADARVLFLTVNGNLCNSVWRQVASLRTGAELARWGCTRRMQLLSHSSKAPGFKMLNLYCVISSWVSSFYFQMQLVCTATV
jgi:hypothetical protein